VSNAKKKTALILALSPLALFAALPAQAQTGPVSPSAEAGLRLARTMCSSCHMVELGAATALADVPPFMEIARKPGQTSQRLQGFMIAPHPPMPTLQLTRQNLKDLAAYILSLAPPEAAPKP
jgi:mono/diheme cytochrome c family protein